MHNESGRIKKTQEFTLCCFCCEAAHIKVSIRTNYGHIYIYTINIYTNHKQQSIKGNK